MAFFDVAIVGGAAFMENILELPYGNGRCFFCQAPRDIHRKVLRLLGRGGIGGTNLRKPLKPDHGND